MQDTRDSEPGTTAPPDRTPRIIHSGFGTPPLTTDPNRSQAIADREAAKIQGDGETTQEPEPWPPGLLDLDPVDEEAAYLKARAEFARILLSQWVIDPLGRRVLFEFGSRGGPESAQFCAPVDPRRRTEGRIEDSCWHVCFKEPNGNHNRSQKIPRTEFKIERARRIPLILPTLTREKTIIHESPRRTNPLGQSYTTWIPPDPATGKAQDFFAVIVRRRDNPKEVAFVTAYSLEDQKEMQEMRNEGRRLYPVTAKKNRRK